MAGDTERDKQSREGGDARRRQRQTYKTCEAGCTCRECLPLPDPERRLERTSRAADCGCIVCREYLLSL